MGTKKAKFDTKTKTATKMEQTKKKQTKKEQEKGDQTTRSRNQNSKNSKKSKKEIEITQDKSMSSTAMTEPPHIDKFAQPSTNKGQGQEKGQGKKHINAVDNLTANEGTKKAKFDTKTKMATKMEQTKKEQTKKKQTKKKQEKGDQTTRSRNQNSENSEKSKKEIEITQDKSMSSTAMTEPPHIDKFVQP